MNTKDLAGLAKFVAPTSQSDGIPDSLKASSAGKKAEDAAVAELEAQENRIAEPAEPEESEESTESTESTESESEE